MAENPLPNRFHLAQCISALNIEVKTGMKHSRGSVLRMVQDQYGVKAKTKKGALAELRAQYKELTGFEYGPRDTPITIKNS